MVSKKVILYRKLASVLNHSCQMPMLHLWNYPYYCLLQIKHCMCLLAHDDEKWKLGFGESVLDGTEIRSSLFYARVQ